MAPVIQPQPQPQSPAKQAGVTLRGILEGVLGIGVALIALFAPLFRINAYIVSADVSAATLLMQASRYIDYLDDARVGVLVCAMFIVTMIAAGIVLALRGFRAAGFGKPKTKVSVSADAIVIVICSIVLVALLAYLRSETYGLISGTGWVWVLLVLGILLLVLEVSIAKAQSKQS